MGRIEVYISQFGANYYQKFGATPPSPYRLWRAW